MSDRDKQGRFSKGNNANHRRGRPNYWRELLIASVSEEDFIEVVERTVRAAINGDQPAAKIVFERLCGKPVSSELASRLDELEERIDRLLRENHQP
jgi:hypothetical protein